MAELTRGQKAARTRAKNKALREAQATTEAVLETVPGNGTTVPAAQVGNFLASLFDIERETYGDVQAGTVVVARIAGHDLVAKYDGEDWQMQF